jgi:AraC-like DNA-binding protein
VRLGARIGTLSLPASDLELPFATFNPSLLAVLDPALQAEQSMGSAVCADAVASVRHVLRRRLGDGEISLRHVTDELGVSARTLQRQLSEAGTSFTELLQDTRRERALFYLRQSDLSLSEIAFLLGFDTPSSFFRAFGRWTGQTPGAFRHS